VGNIKLANEMSKENKNGFSHQFVGFFKTFHAQSLASFSVFGCFNGLNLPEFAQYLIRSAKVWSKRANGVIDRRKTGHTFRV